MKGTCSAGLLGNGICGQDGECCREGSCQFDFFEPVEQNCWNCKHLDDVNGASAEYNTGPIYTCIEYDHYGNLKSFPFKKEMDCFDC